MSAAACFLKPGDEKGRKGVLFLVQKFWFICFDGRLVILVDDGTATQRIVRVVLTSVPLAGQDWGRIGHVNRSRGNPSDAFD
jgi:hypothetical protein